MNAGILLSWMRWHRRLGIIACVPMLMWCISGVLHPLMSRVKPHVAVQHAPALALKSNEVLSIAPQAALMLLGLQQVHDMRMVRFNGHLWWQVFATADSVPVYVDAGNGHMATNGDKIYATYLARTFSGDKQTGVKDIARVTRFSSEYPAIHRLLPVWRVAFERQDGLTAFVDTSSSRLGALADDKRFLFLRFFDWFHAWGWLDGVEAFKIIILTVICSLCLIVGVFGLLVYGGMMGKWGKTSAGVGCWAWFHRQIGVLFSIGLLMFAASGVWQALSHWHPDMRQQFYDRALVSSSSLRASFPALVSRVTSPEKVKGVSLNMVHDVPCWRILMNDGHVMYWRADDGILLKNGEQIYARQLARSFAGMDDTRIASIRYITRFTDEYGFIDKRLPVWRIDYDTPSRLRVYVETGTGHLALRTDDRAAVEQWAFTNLHKWGLINAFGKDVRDSVMALFSFGNAMVAGFGGYLYLRRRSKKSFHAHDMEVGKT